MKTIEIKTLQEFIDFIQGDRPEGVKVVLSEEVILWMYDTQEFVDWNKLEPLLTITNTIKAIPEGLVWENYTTKNRQ